jgi:hypothetical protein
MRRRHFITLVGGAVAWPLAARAQQPDRVRRIGVLMVLAESDPQSRRRIIAFQQGLEKLGWTVGRNLAVDYRWGVSDPEGARTTTSELLSLAPDLILANAVSALRGAQQATRFCHPRTGSRRRYCAPPRIRVRAAALRLTRRRPDQGSGTRLTSNQFFELLVPAARAPRAATRLPRRRAA